MLNSIGNSIEPCGTPYLNGLGAEQAATEPPESPTSQPWLHAASRGALLALRPKRPQLVPAPSAPELAWWQPIGPQMGSKTPGEAGRGRWTWGGSGTDPSRGSAAPTA